MLHFNLRTTNVSTAWANFIPRVCVAVGKNPSSRLVPILKNLEMNFYILSYE